MTEPTLYLVATPIGHLGDMTYRAVETLKTVDLIAAEDTRHTAKLLRHYGIGTKMVPFHAHNEARSVGGLIEAVRQGKSVAVVTDAGSPGISDPGYSAVRAAIEAGVPVTALPGPAALIPALTLSGLPAHAFTFRGFPPRKSGARARFLAADADLDTTLIYYESPYRIGKLVAAALEVFGDRPAALANDLTKLHERVDRLPLAALADRVTAPGFKPLGEYVLLIAGAEAASSSPSSSPEAEA